jgi:hypothetical protein
MATTTTAVPVEKVKDPELAVWLSQDTGETREILVDAALPGRQVLLRQNSNGRWSPSGLQTGSDASGRRETLSKLKALLVKILDTSPVVLESAGAIVVRANSRQVREFVGDPLVRSVRPNRKLHMRI